MLKLLFITECSYTHCLVFAFCKYSRTSMARTPMVRLPWFIQTHFWVPMKFFRYLEKTNMREIFLFYYEIVCCVYLLESPHRGDSNEYTQHTIIFLKIENISINYRYLLPGLAPWLNLIGWNYPSLEQISIRAIEQRSESTGRSIVS